MKALKKKVTNTTPKKKTKEYTYSGNMLVNEIPKPQEKFFQFLNTDIFNTDLLDFEFRLLIALISLKNDTKVSNKALATKFDKGIRTINRTLESLIQKQYIHISTDKELIIRRLGKNDIPLPIITFKSLIIKYVQGSKD